MVNRRAVPILVLLIGCALFMSIPAHGENEASLDTPEGTISRYIEALRQGSLEGVKAVSQSPDDAFYLPRPVNILRYAIRGKKILRKGDLEGLDLRMQPRVGDVQLDGLQVREAEGQTTYHMFSYWMRPMDGEWKIYDRSVWGGP